MERSLELALEILHNIIKPYFYYFVLYNIGKRQFSLIFRIPSGASFYFKVSFAPFFAPLLVFLALCHNILPVCPPLCSLEKPLLLINKK